MKSQKKSAAIVTESSTPDQEETTAMKTTTKTASTVTESSTPDQEETTAMKSTKNSAAAVNATSEAPEVASGLIDPVPTDVAPTPPEDFVSSKPGRGVRPQRSQINLALKVATELRTSTAYTMVFGTAAPDPQAVANALTLARGWSDKLHNAEAWYEYVKEEETLAWRKALALAAPLRVPLEMNLVRDASVAEDLPSTAAFFAVGKDRSLKGAATKKKAKGTTKGAAAATAAQPTAATTSTASAANVTDPVKAAAVRLLN